jgi:hypothetical protein
MTTPSLREVIEQAAIDDPLFVAEEVVRLCDALDFISNLAHETDSSKRAHDALAKFKRQIKGR